MKVKEVERSAAVAWSPADQYPIMLAAGSAAHQVDIGSNSAVNSTLDLYTLNLEEPGLDLKLSASATTANKYHKLVWGGGAAFPTVVGGCDSGVIEVHNVAKMMSSEQEDSLVTRPSRHTGAVRALDFNSFQTNLLATGACESEIFIWDLNQMGSPMTPGVKPQPYEDVVCLAWNKQVQHILASAFGSRCIVWDLRKNEPIIKLTDSTSRVRWKDLAWHPDVPTQLCLASEDDTNPVIQLWDLRFATSPLRSLQGHTRGVLSLAWCSHDSDLMISCAKDNKILCWNPNSNDANGEMICEIPNTQQWIFEVDWCPRNPALVVSCSCDNRTSIYSLMGSNNNQIQTTNKIADSFPGMEQLNQNELVTGSGQHQPSSGAVEMKKPPKWLRQPVGASFAFGGKLLSFGLNTAVTGQSVVSVSQVSTENQLVERAQRLRRAVAEGSLEEVCRNRTSRGEEIDDPLWRYLGASFAADHRAAIKELLGYQKKASGKSSGPGQNYDVDNLAENMATLNQNELEDASLGVDKNSGVMNSFGAEKNGPEIFDSLQAPLAEPKAQEEEKTIPPFKILTDNDMNGNVCRALLVGSVEGAVDMCMNDGRMAEAIILSMVAGPQVLARTQHKYFQESEGYLSRIIEAVVTEDWTRVVASCDLTSWKEALVAVLTYAKEEELPVLCEKLGSRLEQAGGVENLSNAEVCYVASGNIAPLIHKRTSNTALTSESVQDLVELVLVGQCAMGARGEYMTNNEEVSRLLYLYADMLAAQGELELALSFIGHLQDEPSAELSNRLRCAIGLKQDIPQQMSHQQHQAYSRKSSTPGFQTVQQQPMQMQPMQMQPPQLQPIQMQPPQLQPMQIQPPMQNVVGGPQHQQQYLGGTKPAPPPGHQPIPQQPMNAVVPPPPVSAVAPPPSSSQHPRSTPSPLSHGGLITKKYVVDPSVQGGGGYGGRNFGVPQPMPNYPTPGGGCYTGVPGFPPTPTSAAPSTVRQFQPPTGGVFQPAANNGGWNQFGQPPQQQRPPSVPPPAQQQPSPLTQFQQPQTFSPLSGAPPPVQQPQMQPPPTGATAPPPPMTNASPGWNDPPPISGQPRHQQTLYNNYFPRPQCADMSPVHAGTRKWDSMLSSHHHHNHRLGDPIIQYPNFHQQLNKSDMHQNPITHPLGPQAGLPPPNQAPLPCRTGPTGALPPGAVPPDLSYLQPHHQGPLHPGPPPSFNSMPQQMNSINGGGYTTVGDEPRGGVAVGRQAEPPTPKAPLPEKYAYMQKVFDELRLRCTTTANNPQLKKKLEDVSRKLETLYDALRESRLSPTTLSGLERLVALLDGGDYTAALGQHTQMVSGPDFAQIASFMPGLKMLVQSALQLGVYLH